MAKSHKETDDKFSADESQRRFEAALRGARISGHKSMKEIAPKRAKPQRNRKAKSKR